MADFGQRREFKVADRVADQHVEPPECLHGAFDGANRGRFFGDIGDQRFGAPAGGANVSGDTRHALGVDVDADQRGAFGGKALRDGAADAAAGAGDDGGFCVQLHDVCISLQVVCAAARRRGFRGGRACHAWCRSNRLAISCTSVTANVSAFSTDTAWR